jgi:DNA polymerase
MVLKAGADDRLRHLTQYHGAATGRWAGRGVQIHNLRRDTLSEAQVDSVFALLREMI